MVLLWHTVPVNSVEDLRTRKPRWARRAPIRRRPSTRGSSMRPSQQDEARQRLSGPERGPARHGARRARRLSERLPERADLHRPTGCRRSSPRPSSNMGLSGWPNWATCRSHPICSPTRTTNCDAGRFAPLALGRPLVMPPDAPAERVAAMRKALADTSRIPSSWPRASAWGSPSMRRAPARSCRT